MITENAAQNRFAFTVFRPISIMDWTMRRSCMTPNAQLSALARGLNTRIWIGYQRNVSHVTGYRRRRRRPKDIDVEWGDAPIGHRNRRNWYRCWLQVAFRVGRTSAVESMASEWHCKLDRFHIRRSSDGSSCFRKSVRLWRARRRCGCGHGRAVCDHGSTIKTLTQNNEVMM